MCWLQYSFKNQVNGLAYDSTCLQTSKLHTSLVSHVLLCQKEAILYLIKGLSLLLGTVTTNMIAADDWQETTPISGAVLDLQHPLHQAGHITWGHSQELMMEHRECT